MWVFDQVFFQLVFFDEEDCWAWRYRCFFLFRKMRFEHPVLPRSFCVKTAVCWVFSFNSIAWNPKQPDFYGCFNWMIQNLYLGNGCFTKHPFKSGCLGFEVIIVCVFACVGFWQIEAIEAVYVVDDWVCVCGCPVSAKLEFLVVAQCPPARFIAHDNELNVELNIDQVLPPFYWVYLVEF